MLPILGLLIVLVAGYAIIKRYENRLVLLGAGLLMSLIALKPGVAFDQFQKSMTNGGLITAICSVLGFAYVMKLTGCDRHLVHLCTGFVKRFRFALIPLSALVTLVIGIALPSASGVAAAVGAVLIPVMLAAGIHPAMAAAAIVIGSYGSNLSPGSSHIVMVAKLAQVSEVQVISAQMLPTFITTIVAALMLTAWAFVKKEDRGHLIETEVQAESLKVNLFKALVPVLPLVLLLLGSLERFKAWNMQVSTAMLIGAIVALLLGLITDRVDPTEVTKSFFDGMGKAYADIMGIIIAAGVFTAGLKAVGLIDMLLNSMKGATSIAAAAGTWGPMIVAALSGSGDAATLAFNEAVTPHAAQLGLSVVKLGNLALLSGSLGRTMSPVAGVVIVAAGLAKASPIEVVKRTAPGMIVASLIAFVMLGF